MTFLNTKKKALNENGVVDSLGSLFLFFVPSFIGAIYSAILFTTSPYGPDNSDNFVQMDPSRSRWGQGGFQLIGLAITVGIAVAAGLLIAAFFKIVNKVDKPEDLFDDDQYIEKDSQRVSQSKIVKVDN